MPTCAISYGLRGQGKTWGKVTMCCPKPFPWELNHSPAWLHPKGCGAVGSVEHNASARGKRPLNKRNAPSHPHLQGRKFRKKCVRLGFFFVCLFLKIQFKNRFISSYKRNQYLRAVCLQATSATTPNLTRKLLVTAPQLLATTLTFTPSSLI